MTKALRWSERHDGAQRNQSERLCQSEWLSDSELTDFISLSDSHKSVSRANLGSDLEIKLFRFGLPER